MFVAARIVTETNPTGQIWAAAITALVGLVVVVVNSHSNNLGKAERLADIASKMLDSSERRLVENLRDDYVTSWALKQMAPTHRWALAVSYVAYGLAGLTLLMWWAYSVTYEYALWTWLIYIAGIVLVALAVLIHGRRSASRARWIRDERADRWMREPLHSRLRDATKER